MDYQERQGEIDLIDLWNIVARRWKLLAVTVVVGTALGVAYALLKPQVFGYRTLIEIGTQLVNGESVLIDQPESLRTKISEGYAPVVLRDFYASHPEIETVFQLDITAPKDTNLIVVQQEQPRKLREEIENIHQAVVTEIMTDHERVIAQIRKGLENRIQETKNRLDQLESEQALLEKELERLQERHESQLAILEERIALTKAELKRLDELQALVRSQVSELQNLISQAQQNRQKAISEANDASGAMTLMLINDELQRNQKLLADLRERQAVGIPNQRSRYEQQIQELQNEKLILASRLSDERDRFNEKIREVSRKQEEVTSDIASLELKLENLSDTRAVVIAAESLRPVGPGKAVIVVIAGMASGFFGLMLIFLLHLYQLARRRESTATS